MSQKPFSGFPEGAVVTPIPNLFFTAVMPHIKDIIALKTVLHIFWLLSRRRGYPRFVTFTELSIDPDLIKAIAEEGTKSTDAVLKRALALAVQSGAILHFSFDKDGTTVDTYFMNTEAEKKTIDRIRQGELVLPGLLPQRQNVPETRQLSDIYSLYEQNIGMLTPMIAEELQGAEDLYPADWIESAFREAVSQNKRNWKYIARILERWTSEGRNDGKPGRNFKKESGSIRYVRGKYGHMVKR